MNDEKIRMGKQSEQLALEMLESKGMTFVEKNYYCKHGEIDLIMKDRNDLVFVEVRSKSKVNFGTPVETINYSKRRKIEKTARDYLYKHNLLNKINCRFDLVGVIIGSSGEKHIEHIPGAFICGE